MNTITSDQRVNTSFFHMEKRISSLPITRAMRNVLIALRLLVDNNTLDTSLYPLTIDRFAEKAGYSRSQLFVILNDLEAAGHVERIRHRRQLPSGEWINDPTTYRIIASDEEAATLVARHTMRAPRQRHPKRERVQRPAPMQEAPSGPVVVARVAMEAPIAVAPPKIQLAPMTHDEMLLPSPAPTADAETNRLAGVIAQNAAAAIRHAENATEKSARHALKAIDIARYTLAAYARAVCDSRYITEDEIIDCIYEWVEKVVEKNNTFSPIHLGKKLMSFFLGKGDGIAFVRRDMLLSQG
jgi:hypothetical protein